MLLFLNIFIYINFVHSYLWPKGVVHYSINKTDYDIHSQDEMVSTFNRLQKEVCVKFFRAPENYNVKGEKVLRIKNEEKLRECSAINFNFSGSVVDMPLGYNCINQKDIAKTIVQMLRAGISEMDLPINSNDLIKKFQEQDDEQSTSTLLSAVDRNFINAFYFTECGALSLRSIMASRRLNEDLTRELSTENEKFYEKLTWPLGIVMYGVDEKLRNSEDALYLRISMRYLEMDSCVVFQEIEYDNVLEANNLLWFGAKGEDAPQLGFKKGIQYINLHSMVHGSPGHVTHIANNLMRALGIPMMSNRADRDNYIHINWNNIDEGKQHYFEKLPVEAWIHLPYDFSSVTHGSATYMCKKCETGAQTIQALQDNLWQRTLSMGRGTKLSESDKTVLKLLYQKLCDGRKMLYKAIPINKI